MHPAFYHWWKSMHESSGCGERPGWGRDGGGHERHHGWHHAAAGHGDEGGGGFGVRRPLRFLAWKLDLDERQVGELARVISELKTERQQAEVDGRRSLTSFADAVAGAAFDDAKATAAAAARVASAEKLRDAVVKALREIHALLDDEQRAKLAYLIRTGALVL